MMVMLFEHPLVQSSFLMLSSWLMILYILSTGPFKAITNAVQQLLCEGVMLLVNTCVFINAVMDHIGAGSKNTRENLGNVVVTSNLVFNFVPMVFMGISLVQFLKETYQYIQVTRQKRKIAHLQVQTRPLKSEADSTNKTMITNDLTKSNYTMGEDFSPNRRNRSIDDLETMGSARLQEQRTRKIKRNPRNFDTQEQTLKTQSESPIKTTLFSDNSSNNLGQQWSVEDLGITGASQNQANVTGRSIQYAFETQDEFIIEETEEDPTSARGQKKMKIKRRPRNERVYENNWGSQPQLQIDFSKEISRDNSGVFLRNESHLNVIAETSQEQDQIRRKIKRNTRNNAILRRGSESPMRTIFWDKSTSHLIRDGYTGQFTNDLDISGSFGNQTMMNSKQNSGIFELQFMGEQGNNDMTIEEIKEDDIQDEGRRKMRIRRRQRNISQNNHTQSNEDLEILSSFHYPINNGSRKNSEIFKVQPSQGELKIEEVKEDFSMSDIKKMKIKRRRIPRENNNGLNDETRDFYQEKKYR